MRITSSSEEYEMVDNPIHSLPGSSNDDIHNNDDNNVLDSGHYDDSDSESSIIFEQLDSSNGGKDNDDNEGDNFHNSAIFQEAILHYNQGQGKSNKLCYMISISGFIIWLILLLIYSNITITDISTWKWQTDVIEFNHENITLNPYSVKNLNISMSTIRNGKLLPNFRYIKWLNRPQYPTQSPDDKHANNGYYLTRGSKGEFVIINPLSESTSVFLESPQFAYQNNFFYIEDIIFNPYKPIDDDNVYHIVITDQLPQWRHSTFSLYWLFKPITGEFIPIQPITNTNEDKFKPTSLTKLHFAKFSPLGDKVVFGVDHNLHWQNLNDLKVYQITDSGSPDIFNGKPDWVYEEEILATDTFFWISPDASTLIFATINDTEVLEYDVDYYIKNSNNVGLTYELSPSKRIDDVNQYPIKKSIKYPKPGTNDPKLSLFSYSFQDKVTKALKFDNKNLSDFIIYDGNWISDEYFHLKLSDRKSKILSKQVIELKNNDIKEIDFLNATVNFNGWINKVSPIVPIKQGYLDKSWINNRCHLLYYETPLSTEPIILAPGDYDVFEKTDVIYNDVEEIIYTLSNIKGSTDSHLIGVDLKGEVKVNLGGDETGKYEFESDSNGQFITLEYYGPDIPWQKIINTVDLHLLESEGQNKHENFYRKYLNAVPMVSDFTHLKTQMTSYNLPTKKYKIIKLNNGKHDIDINVIEILPPNFNPNGKIKYPILVHAYGGPDSQTVDKSSIYGFNDVVSATLNAIVLIIDPRGTGGKGSDFKAFANNNIGYWEGRDIITITSEYIKKNKRIIDQQSVAIWGWSYGGFTTLKTLELDHGEIFKFGMAVAPVTNWLFYNAFYTERYMNLPTENDNYSKTAKISKFDNFKALTRFLIMHGTADDNVHLQNSLWLLDKLNTNGTENYDVQFFPDNDHAIHYHNSDVIIYDKLFNWLKDAFIGKFADFL